MSASNANRNSLLSKLGRPSQVAMGVLVGFGFVAGILFWGGFNWSMELTNTEKFCITCHEMQENVYMEYQETIHYANRTGVRATCPDCHVPKTWVHKIARKIQASNELFHHFKGTIDTPEKFEAKRMELAQNVWRTMKKTDSRECRNCHSFESMDYVVQEKRAQQRHAEAIEQKITCIECHQGVAHELPAGAIVEGGRLAIEIK
ncbi:MAG: NapC/NirT family cytochrome c [Alphaproteobacteria bacterium]|nr:NapC/NirT family cytochrome c [Alphaproteobacteria bacterium]MBF0250448.1 NapC/NirT family cytochrome c [Alphaproteobacteria bacterium]